MPIATKFKTFELNALLTNPINVLDRVIESAQKYGSLKKVIYVFPRVENI